jgi:hypothetical protein
MPFRVGTRRAKGLFTLALLVCTLFAASPKRAMAWGDEGHKVVAKVAEHYLTDTTRQRILDLLKQDQKKDFYARECPQAQTASDFMMCVSTWADRVRSDRPETANWHFVDIPNKPTQGASPLYNEARDCQCTRDGDCIVRAIDQFRIILARADSTDRERQRRIEALKFIIHFVGDLHQPLHDADNHDRGGNDVKVLWFGKEYVNAARKYDWNLHSVWDTGIIEKTNPNADDMAERILATLANQNIKSIEKGTVVDWANEAHGIAVRSAYAPTFLAKKVKVADGSERVDLGDEYYNAQKGYVDDQLRKAGVRLALVLNQAMGS